MMLVVFFIDTSTSFHSYKLPILCNKPWLLGLAKIAVTIPESASNGDSFPLNHYFQNKLSNSQLFGPWFAHYWVAAEAAKMISIIISIFVKIAICFIAIKSILLLKHVELCINFQMSPEVDSFLKKRIDTFEKI
jgi:hypothetical protein